MFNPEDFLNVAQKLHDEAQASNDNATARTAINRAYYASYLTARQKAKIKDDGAGSHKAVITHYKTKKLQIGNRLSDLFMRRKEADYNLEANVTKLQSGTALKQAKSILVALGTPDIKE